MEENPIVSAYFAMAYVDVEPGDMISLESTTYKASGIRYELLINGSPPPLHPIRITSSVQAEFDAAGVNAKKGTIGSEYISLPSASYQHRNGWNWYDGSISVDSYNKFRLHETRFAIGPNAGYGTFRQGWKIGTVQM